MQMLAQTLIYTLHMASRRMQSCHDALVDGRQGILCRGLAVNMGIEDFSSANQWKPFAKEALAQRQ